MQLKSATPVGVALTFLAGYCSHANTYCRVSVGIIDLPGVAAAEHAVPMAESVPEPMAIPQVAASIRLSRARLIIIKILALTALTLALGFAQGWASSRCYKPDHVAGFHMGLLHGMLMPAALPGLLMGQDLPIYAPDNSGRPYKIGYIFGINTCGTIFFGIAFWHPRRRR